MDGGQAPGGAWTNQDGGAVSALTAPAAARVFTEHSLPLGAHSSILQGHFLAQNLCLMSGYFEMCDTLSNILKAPREGRKRFPTATFTP